MSRTPRLTFTLLFFMLGTLSTLGCERESTPSATVGGINFVQDLDGERKVVRIELSPLQPVECMRAALPVPSNVTWKESLLDASLHADLIAAVFDQPRVAAYEEDTNRAESNDRICTPRSGEPLNPDCIDVEVCETRSGGELCYRPEANLATDGDAWRFVLHPDFEPPVSDESRELIDAFLLAHDACWSGEGQLENGGTFPG
jgi:hypothetical protein